MTITLDNLTAGYDRRPAVHHLSGIFQDASLTAIVGPNGGGKSTLLKAMAGFLPPMSGEIDLGELGAQEIAYLPQLFEIDRTFPLSVLDVVLLGHWPRLGALGRVRSPHKEEAIEALRQVDMANFASRPIASLSSGQWQRVLFARLCIQRAKLILLDEPFAAIDGRTTHDLLHILEDWRKASKTIICVMHDFQLVRDHFPQALVLARDLIAWGDTKDAMRDENLAKASALAGVWSEHADACQINPRSFA